MKQLYTAVLTLMLTVILTTSSAQVTLSANGPGDTYSLIESKGFGVESPDCRHTAFGPHITEVFDNTLNKYVFVFHSHPTLDDDRCGADDRTRIEIKGGNGSPADLQHTSGQTAYYRWKFKLDAGFKPSSRFTHIFQIKAIDGDAGAPLITITPRAGSPEKMQIIHSTGSGSGGLGTVTEVNLAPFKGAWVEAFVKYKSSEGSAGTFEITLKRLSDGATLLSYSNASLDMWREGASYNRPKWGVYRGKDAVLRDEEVRFADFCVSESSASLCPSDIGTANQPPAVSITAPANNASFAAPASISIEANASDNDGTVSKVEFFNGATKLGEDASSPYAFSWTGVAAGSYAITAKATDDDNASTTSATVNITVTSPPGCSPVTASGDDGNVPANVLDNNLATRWSASGDGQWIQFCLNTPANVTGVQIAFYTGNVRSSTFDVLVGSDGTTFTTAAAGVVSSGTSTALETFTFPPVSGKYVRIVGHGNSVNAWNSYTEVKIQTATGGAQTYTLNPVADAYVRDGTNAAITHGTTDSTLLITKVSPSGQLNNAREAYLRFQVPAVSGTVSSATLRVYGKIDGTSVPSVPVAVFPVSNTAWTENAITWNNKPAGGTTGLDTTTVTNTAYAYFEWDVTAYVTAELAATRNDISLLMKSLAAHDPRIFFNSSEAASNKPQLVITVEEEALNSKVAPALQLALTEKSTKKKNSLRVLPNPFKGSGSIEFHLSEAGQANIVVYDLMGRQVAQLVNSSLPAGDHRVRFNPTGTGGVYILKLVHKGKTITTKIQQQ